MKLHTLAALLLIPSAALLTGCKTQELQSQRDSLMTQNKEAQDELNHTRAALEGAENERNSLAAENARLTSELDAAKAAAARAPVAPSKVPDSHKSGFSHIEGVEAVAGPGTMTARVPGDVLFEPGKVELKLTAKKTLEEIAKVIKSEYAGKSIRIEGYTDTDPIKLSKWYDNLELSLERAAAVQRYLEKEGVPANAMYSAGFGDRRPRDSKPRSRRVEIVVITE